MTLKVQSSNMRDIVMKDYEPSRWRTSQENMLIVKNQFAKNAKIINFVKGLDGYNYVCGCIGPESDMTYKIWKSMNPPSQSYMDAEYVTEELDKSVADGIMEEIEKAMNTYTSSVNNSQKIKKSKVVNEYKNYKNEEYNPNVQKSIFEIQQDVYNNFAKIAKSIRSFDALDGYTYVCGYVGKNEESGDFRIWKSTKHPAQSYLDANYITDILEKSTALEIMEKIENM